MRKRGGGFNEVSVSLVETPGLRLSRREPRIVYPAPTTCLAPSGVRRAISLGSRETSTASHPNTWCTVVPSATMSHAHSSVSVRVGFVRPALPIPAPRAVRARPGVGGELRNDGIDLRARPRSQSQRESPAERKNRVPRRRPVTSTRPRPRSSSPRSPGLCSRASGQSVNAARGPPRDPAGGGVSPPTRAIGSGEQRGRPTGFSDRAELVI